MSPPFSPPFGFCWLFIICGCTWHVLVQSLPGSQQPSLEYLNPKYNRSIPRLLFQFSSYPFNFTFISCLYTGPIFFFLISQNHYLPHSPSHSVPRASLALFILSFLLHLNSFLPSLLWLWVFIFPSVLRIPLIISFFLAPQTTSSAVTGQGPKYDCVCVSFITKPCLCPSTNYFNTLRGQETHTLQHTYKPSFQSLVAFHQKAHFLIPD